jgi:hypothetical protein
MGIFSGERGGILASIAVGIGLAILNLAHRDPPRASYEAPPPPREASASPPLADDWETTMKRFTEGQ